MACAACCWAQSPTSKPEADAPDEPSTVLPHPGNTRWYISGQVNFIYQTHPPFPAKYTGPNSLLPRYEKAISRVMTLCTGVELNKTTEVLVDVEETGGAGLSSALGLGGFTDLDVVRNPELSKAPYLARAMFHKVIALSSDTVESERNPLSLFTSLPRRRLEVRVGKFSMVDFFDLNSAAATAICSSSTGRWTTTAPTTMPPTPAATPLAYSPNITTATGHSALKKP